jgi:tetratricopeptide (TPR) repeat protein
MGRFDEAESMLRQGEARAEAANDELTLGYAFYGHHVIAWLRGDLEALDQLAQQVDSNADYPPGMIRYMKLTALAETALERGDHAKAISVFESLWISGSDPGRIAVFQADRALDLARAYCAHGDREAALREVGVAEELFRTRPELWDSMPFLIIDLARIRLALHGAEAAEEMIALLDRRIATMEARGWGGYLPLTLWIRAQAADLLGDVAAAKRDLRAAREGYQAMEAPRRVAQADAELAALA